MQGFEPYQQTRIALCLAHPLMLKHARLVLGHLGFSNLTCEQMPRSYFEAVGRVLSTLRGESELVLLNLPPKPNRKKVDDVQAVYELIDENYNDLKTQLAKSTSDPLKYLSKTVPMIEVGDFLREKILQSLVKYRVPTAFFMSRLEPMGQASQARRAAIARENLQLHLREMTGYLKEYFENRDDMVARLDEKLNEKELSQRKKEYDEFMAQAAAHREEKNWEAAILALRKAIEVYPSDIEAYLESGRVHIRKKEYARALSRFTQAEDLFTEAPAPNVEIGNLRLIQVKEKIEQGLDPESKDVKALLAEAVENFGQANEKAAQQARTRPQGIQTADDDVSSAIGQTILKWDLAEMLGPRHPAVKELSDLADASMASLSKLPMDKMSSRQLVAMGLRYLEHGDLPQARAHYFEALKDRGRFTETCTEINYFGIRLRTMGHLDEAVGVYLDLLSQDPHNRGSVYWNLAVVYAFKDSPDEAAGYMARALYTDPLLAREKEFYESLNPAMLKTLLALFKAVRGVYQQKQRLSPPSALVSLYAARARLDRLIEKRENAEALKLFCGLFAKAPKLLIRPEFLADAALIRFLSRFRPALAKSPAGASRLKMVDAWLAYAAKHPAPAYLVRFTTLCRKATSALENKGDQRAAAHFLGQAFVAVPLGYFKRPDFFALDTLPELAVELKVKFQDVDPKRFPQF